MNVLELAVYRLHERNKITREEAMVLSSLLENGKMNLLELSLERGLELHELKDAINFLLGKNAIQFSNGNYYIADALEALNRLIGEDNEMKVFVQLMEEA